MLLYDSVRHRTIPLLSPTGKPLGSALIDVRDVHYLLGHHWRLDHGYLSARIIRWGRVEKVYLHRLIMSLSPDNPLQVDHRNRNRLDNRRENLRPSNQQQNMQNVTSHRDSTSKYRNVNYEAERKRWAVHIRANGRNRFIGRYPTEEEANLAAVSARRRLLKFATD
jgi:hypothetical protein